MSTAAALSLAMAVLEARRIAGAEVPGREPERILLRGVMDANYYGLWRA